MNYNPRAISLTALFGILLGLFCQSITSAFSFTSQTGVTNPMDAATYFALLGAISVTVNRVVEKMKDLVLVPAQNRFRFSDNVYVGALLLTTFILSLIGCWVSSANFFSIIPFSLTVPALVGFVISAGIVTTGANGIHQVTELWTLLMALLAVRSQTVKSETVTLTEVNTAQATQTLPRVG